MFRPFILSFALACVGALFTNSALAQPTNNNFANGQVLTGNSGNTSGNSTGANAQTGEPAHAGGAAHHSVWYRWQATFNGRATFVINSAAFTPVAAVYTGAAVNALTARASDNNPTVTLPLPNGCCSSAIVSFNAVSGTLYHIAVDGKTNTAFGDFTLRFGPSRTLSGALTDLAGRALDSNNPHAALIGDAQRLAPAPAPNGRYSFTLIQGDNYHLEPATTQFVGFEPFDRDYQPLNSEVTNANFVARTPVYNVSGRITDSAGAPLSNVQLVVTENGTRLQQDFRTQADGAYSINVFIIYNDYTVTPQPPNTAAVFDRTNRDYPRIKTNFLDQNYRANRLPTVRLSAPANGARFNAPATINLTAEASDADGTIARVEFFAGGARLGEDTTAPFSFQWNNVAPGDYSLTARATDNQGATTTSGAIAVTVASALANVSAASFTGAVAAESIVAVFGNNLATTTQTASGTPLPTTLGGASVRLRDRAGNEQLAPLFFVAPGQINYQLAPGLQSGLTNITINSGAGATVTGAMQVEQVAPGLFTANANGQGVAAAVALRVRGTQQTFEQAVRFDTQQNRFVAVPLDLGPAGDQVFLVLYGTGFRFRSALAAVRCTVGGVNADVSFAGAQGGLIGVDQANVLLPRVLSGRGEVDVVFTVDGKTANTVKVSIK